MFDRDGKPCEEPVGEMSKAAFGDGEIQYFILPGVWRDEICKGYDYKVVCRLLIELGHLKNDNNRLDARGSLPGMPKTTTYYRISSSIFDHGEG